MVPEPIVTVPQSARKDDLRWSIMKMVAHRLRDQRVEHARRVLRSRSKHVEPRHRELAQSIIDGPGDLIGAKASHDWVAMPPGYGPGMYDCSRCKCLVDSDLALEWCPENPV
jgi:hypothetical protein